MAEGLEPDGRVLVERPGRHGGHARTRQAEGGHRVGHRSGHLAGQEQARKQHPGADGEQAAQAQQPWRRHQLAAHAFGHLAVDPGDRPVELGELVAGGDPLPDRPGPGGGLGDRLGDRQACEAATSALHAALGVIERPPGFGDGPLGLDQLRRGAAAVASPRPERPEREREALGEKHVGDARAVDVEVGGDRHHPRQTGDPHLFAEPPRGEPGMALGAGRIGGEPLQLRCLFEHRGHRRPLLPDGRLRGQFAELAGELRAELLPRLGGPLEPPQPTVGQPPGVAVGMHQRHRLQRRELV